MGDTPGTLLGTMTPAGFERYFAEAGLLDGRPIEPAEVAALLTKYDQHPVRD